MKKFFKCFGTLSLIVFTGCSTNSGDNSIYYPTNFNYEDVLWMDKNPEKWYAANVSFNARLKKIISVDDEDYKLAILGVGDREIVMILDYFDKISLKENSDLRVLGTISRFNKKLISPFSIEEKPFMIVPFAYLDLATNESRPLFNAPVKILNDWSRGVILKDWRTR